MNVEAIEHQPKSFYAYALDEKTIHIRVRTKKDNMNSVSLLYGDKYGWDKTHEQKPMVKFATDQLYDYYEAEITPPYRRLAYAFHFVSRDKSIWKTEKRLTEEKPLDPTGFYEYPYLNVVDIHRPPQWVKDAIFYQIFPERFANGDPSNDPENVERWGGKPEYNNFFGGDLQGVIDHLDYLQQLGITAIYFTPVFEATSNHKYDTIDYMKVDPHFGDNERLKALVQKCHEKGIKVLLDAVFNHSGYFFPPFQDVLKHGKDSKYADWFHIHQYPIQIDPPNYDTFAFTHMMPKFNTENKEVKHYLLNVARYWVEEVGIDGWRLDVANEVDHQFWREFRQVVKGVNPDAYILGEVWHNAWPWLQGDQFDATMNYPVTDSVLNFICRSKITAQQFIEDINHIQAIYPLPVNEVAFNLLDSHDTPRLLTICEENKHKMKLAVVFMMTYMGTPCIYYGDEIGLTGGQDPDCRKTMIWDEERQDLDLFHFYQQMIQLRKSNRALRDGNFQFITSLQDNGAQHEIVAYRRQHNNDIFIVVLNTSTQKTHVTIPLNDIDCPEWSEVFTGTRFQIKQEQLTVEVEAQGYIILKNIL